MPMPTATMPMPTASATEIPGCTTCNYPKATGNDPAACTSLRVCRPDEWLPCGFGYADYSEYFTGSGVREADNLFVQPMNATLYVLPMAFHPLPLLFRTLIVDVLYFVNSTNTATVPTPPSASSSKNAQNSLRRIRRVSASISTTLLMRISGIAFYMVISVMIRVYLTRRIRILVIALGTPILQMNWNEEGRTGGSKGWEKGSKGYDDG